VVVLGIALTLKLGVIFLLESSLFPLFKLSSVLKNQNLSLVL
jgi:hypothetical protein